MTELKIKQPGEGRKYDMDFAALLRGGDTISSIKSVESDPPGELTITSLSKSATRVQFHIAGGTDGQRYVITVKVDTTGGDTDLEGEGILDVKQLP